ncbi:MAG: hypothetical protein FWG13_00200 [Leptospirales bacterium]|nr:hypothetical protein [Leptospirales bacterium]
MGIAEWGLTFITFLLGNKFQIYLLKDIPVDVSFIGILIIMAAIGGAYGMKLMIYMEKNYHEKWKEIYNPKGDGFTSSSRIFEFMSSKDPLNDPVVTKLKRAVIHMEILVGVHVITMLIVFFALKNLKVLFM